MLLNSISISIVWAEYKDLNVCSNKGILGYDWKQRWVRETLPRSCDQVGDGFAQR